MYEEAHSPEEKGKQRDNGKSNKSGENEAQPILSPSSKKSSTSEIQENQRYDYEFDNESNDHGKSKKHHARKFAKRKQHKWRSKSKGKKNRSLRNKGTKNRKRNSSYNNLAAPICNIDDFSLQQKVGRKNARTINASNVVNDNLSDISDRDVQDRLGSITISPSFMSPMNRIPSTVEVKTSSLYAAGNEIIGISMNDYEDSSDGYSVDSDEFSFEEGEASVVDDDQESSVSSIPESLSSSDNESSAMADGEANIESFISDHHMAFMDKFMSSPERSKTLNDEKSIDDDTSLSGEGFVSRENGISGHHIAFKEKCTFSPERNKTKYGQKSTDNNASLSIENIVTSENDINPETNGFREGSDAQLNDAVKILFLGSPHSEEGKSWVVHELSTHRKEEFKSASRKNDQAVNFNIVMDEWVTESSSACGPTRFRLHDLSCDSHHAAELFFSPHSLYVIVWNLAEHLDTSFCDEDDDEPYKLELKRERKRDVIERDIKENIISWVDRIHKLDLSDCVIMPIAVALTSSRLSEGEMNDRCALMKKLLVECKTNQNIVLTPSGYGAPNIIRDRAGITSFQQAIIDTVVGHDGFTDNRSSRLFPNHISSTFPRAKEAILKLKKEGLKAVHFNDLYEAIIEATSSAAYNKDALQKDLEFLATVGEIIYLRKKNAGSDYLQSFVILDPELLVFAIKYGVFPRKESKIASKLPWLAHLYVMGSEVTQRWKSCDYLAEKGTVADVNKTGDLYSFLLCVCEFYGILVPIYLPHRNRSDQAYLLPIVHQEPSLFNGSPWTYKCNKSMFGVQTVLCHSWLFRKAVPVNFFNQIIVAVVPQLAEMHQEGRLLGQIHEKGRLNSDTSALRYVDQLMCYKTAIYARIIERETGSDYSTILELYVSLANIDSPSCVNTSNMRNNDIKLIVCGKGPAGNDGEKIWELGFESVLRKIEDVVSSVSEQNEKEIVCPDCLKYFDCPKDATAWNDVSVSIHAENNCSVVCRNSKYSHRVSARLLTYGYDDCHSSVYYDCINDDCIDDGHIDDDCSRVSAYSALSRMTTMTCVTCETCDNRLQRTVQDTLPSVVLVAIWKKGDCNNEGCFGFGTGFIADKRRGLIVTAGHVCYDIEEDNTIGEPFFRNGTEMKETEAFIGIYDEKKRSACFQYTVDIVVHDLENADVCVLRLREQFREPLSGEELMLVTERSNPQQMKSGLDLRGLKALSLTDDFQHGSKVTLIGYHQEGEFLQEPSIDCSPCLSDGTVIKILKAPTSKVTKTTSLPKKHRPQSNILIKCEIKDGHSGAPCVNSNGEVIGILSFSDPHQEDRCHFAPSSLISRLLKKAKRKTKIENGELQRKETTVTFCNSVKMKNNVKNGTQL